MKKLIRRGMTICLLVIFLYLSNNWLQVTHYAVCLPQLPPEWDGYQILQLSDLHGKFFGQDNQWLVAAIRRIDPDIIVATGDMMNSTDDDGQAWLCLVQQLEQQYPIYFSLGNHEQIARRRQEQPNLYAQLLPKLQAAGVVCLDNRHVVLRRGQSAVHLYGLTIDLPHYSEASVATAALNTAYLQRKIGRPDQAQVNILLAHNPDYFPQYAAWGADLTLSGHIHGGVVRIPTKGGLLSPAREFFPEYDAGHFHADAGQMIVSRGLGNSVIHQRIFNRPQLVVITLCRE